MASCPGAGKTCYCGPVNQSGSSERLAVGAHPTGSSASPLHTLPSPHCSWTGAWVSQPEKEPTTATRSPKRVCSRGEGRGGVGWGGVDGEVPRQLSGRPAGGRAGTVHSSSRSGRMRVFAAATCFPAPCTLPGEAQGHWRLSPVAGWRSALLPCSTRLLSYFRPCSSEQAGAGAVPSQGARLPASAGPLPASRASCTLLTRRLRRWEEGQANWNAPCTCASAPALCAGDTPLRAAPASGPGASSWHCSSLQCCSGACSAGVSVQWSVSRRGREDGVLEGE